MKSIFHRAAPVGSAPFSGSYRSASATLLFLLASCQSAPVPDIVSPETVSPETVSPETVSAGADMRSFDGLLDESLTRDIDARLVDQFGLSHRVRSRGGAVFILSDRSSAEEATRWDLEVVRLAGVPDHIPVYRVVDLSELPKWAHSIAESSIRRSASPPDTPLLLDTGGRVRAELGELRGGARLIVFDRDSKFVLCRSGSPNPPVDLALLRRALAAIENSGSTPVASQR